VAAVCALALLAACSKPDDAAARARPQAQTQRSQANSQQEKLRLYIDCYNRVDSSFHSALNDYTQRVDMDAGPTGRERLTPRIFSVTGAQNCQKTMAQAGALPPSAVPELDQDAAAYAASLQPLEATINEAHYYYDRKKFTDDGFARGKALHKLLVEQSRTFIAASKRFSGSLDQAEDAQNQAKLQQLEKESGRSQQYYLLAAQIQAKALMGLLTQGNVDLDKADAMLEAYGKTISELKEAPGVSMFIGHAYDFRKDARARVDRLRNKTPYSKSDEARLGTAHGWVVKGSPDSLLHYYNRMAVWH